MGYKVDQNEFVRIPEYKKEFNTSTVMYHKDWNWLMPVVQKFSESDKYLGEQDEQDLMQTLLYGYRDDVYRLIVEFIKEYNKYE